MDPRVPATDFDPERGWEDLAGHRSFEAVMTSIESTQWLTTVGLRVLFVGPGFRALIRGVRFNRYSIAHVRTRSPVTLVWERRRASATRRTLLTFIESGTLTVSPTDDGAVPRDYGGLGVVLPGADDVRFELSSGMDLIWFSFDSLEVPEIPERAVLRSDVIADSPLFHSAHAYLKTLAHSAQDSTGRESATLRELTRSVAQALSRGVFEPELGGIATAARAMVNDRASDPLFTVVTMTTELGVSRRTLERECARAGWAPAEELRRARARIASDALAGTAAPLQRIAAISGFGSVDALNRAIRLVYGTTPGALRRGDGAPPPDPGPLSPS